MVYWKRVDHLSKKSSLVGVTRCICVGNSAQRWYLTRRVLQNGILGPHIDIRIILQSYTPITWWKANATTLTINLIRINIWSNLIWLFMTSYSGRKSWWMLKRVKWLRRQQRSQMTLYCKKESGFSLPLCNAMRDCRTLLKLIKSKYTQIKIW